MHSDLIDIVERFGGRRVLIVGDFMLDRYISGDAERISPEAPVPVLRVVERLDRVGGAGSVAACVLALGAEARCFGLLGRDSFGDRVDEFLRESGADTGGLIRVADRPTITKTRLIGLAEHRHRQQILRVDDEVVAPPAPPDADRLVDALREAIGSCDVVCLEDYAKGVLTHEICAAVISAARERGKPVLVDPGRIGDWSKYRGATLLTPNRAEFEIAVGAKLRDDEIDSRARERLRADDLQAIVVTLGRDGARLVTCEGDAKLIPTRSRAVYDNTGAGDAVLAMAAVAIAAGANFEQAVILANIAGGLEVSKFGCVPIPRDDVVREIKRAEDAGRGKLRTLDEILPELAAHRQRGEIVAFTNGCFDLLHPGHVELLEKAKALGNTLVVGVNTDASVRSQHKGEDRPVRTQIDRVRMLTALEAVDYVVLFDEPSVLPLIERLIPDVLVKGGDYDLAGVVGREFVESRGGRVELVDLVAGYSTTREVERIRSGTVPS